MKLLVFSLFAFMFSILFSSLLLLDVFPVSEVSNLSNINLNNNNNQNNVENNIREPI